jgi:hypothetical protein
VRDRDACKAVDRSPNAAASVILTTGVVIFRRT